MTKRVRQSSVNSHLTDIKKEMEKYYGITDKHIINLNSIEEKRIREKEAKKKNRKNKKKNRRK